MATDAEDDDYTEESLQQDVNTLLELDDDATGVDATMLVGRSAVFKRAQQQRARSAATAKES